jgi:hypothetical protein
MKQASEQQRRKGQEEFRRVRRLYSRPPVLKLYHFSAGEPSVRVFADVTDDPIAGLFTGFKRHHEFCMQFI